MTNKKRVGWGTVGVMLALGGCGERHEATSQLETHAITDGVDVPLQTKHVAADVLASPDSSAATASTDVGTSTTVPGSETAIVDRCARMRSLPQWCMERERTRIRKRGTP